MNGLSQWSFTQLVARWNYLCQECWQYDRPADDEFNTMMLEKERITDELEIRGYEYSYISKKWFDAIRY